jgi:hypothetical protein
MQLAFAALYGIFDLRKWLPLCSSAQRFVVTHILRRDAEAFVKNAQTSDMAIHVTLDLTVIAIPRSWSRYQSENAARNQS